jgi:regulator of nucleoside diphosphate kinase
MKYNQIIIEENEFKLLKSIASKNKRTGTKTNQSSLKKLKKELQSAKILPKEKLPNDIVRINSIVALQMSNNVIRSFQIVIPEDSDLIHNKLSILSPIALSLFGCATNDEISWQFHSNPNKLKILEVLQN